MGIQQNGSEFFSITSENDVILQVLQMKLQNTPSRTTPFVILHPFWQDDKISMCLPQPLQFPVEKMNASRCDNTMLTQDCILSDLKSKVEQQLLQYTRHESYF